MSGLAVIRALVVSADELENDEDQASWHSQEHEQHQHPDENHAHEVILSRERKVSSVRLGGNRTTMSSEPGSLGPIDHCFLAGRCSSHGERQTDPTQNP